MTGYDTPFERGIRAAQSAGLTIIGHRDGQARTRCPVHGGSAPDSLAIGIGHDKQLLLKCFADCSFDEVRDALGLTAADCRAEERARDNGKTVIASYAYPDANGEIQFWQDRYFPKTFRPRLPDGSRSLPRERRILYRLPAVLHEVAAGGQVWLVEGEKDADHLAAAGPCATTMPGGTGMGWQESYTDALAGAGEVVIIADRDEAGEKHARKVAASLARRGIPHRIVQSAAGKDVTDHLAAGLGADDLVPWPPAAEEAAAEPELAPLAEEEPPPDPYEESRPAEDAPRSWRPRVLDDILNGTYKAPEPTVGRRDDGVGLFYPGRVHSVVGESEGGKTWLALLAAAAEIQAGRNVVYLDFEDDAPGVVGRLLALGANPEHIRGRFAYIRPEDPLTAGWNRLELGQAVADLRPTLVTIDGVTEGMALHGMELKDNTDVAKFGRMLMRPLSETGAAVVTLDHVTKDREGRGRYAIGGVHKLNGLNGAMYLLENRTPFGVGVTGKSTVRIAKDRPGQLRRHALPGAGGMHWFADLTLKSHGEGFAEGSLAAPIEHVGPFRPTSLMAKVSDALSGAPEPLGVRGITDRVTGNKEHIRAALARLVDEGFVTMEKGPRNAQLHRLAKPFSEDGPP